MANPRSSPPDPAAMRPQQRLRAAQRLAADDPGELAAALAGLTPEQLEALRVEPGFKDLVEACAAVHRLPPAAWRARLVRLGRDAAEAALIEGKAGAIGLVLRLDDALDAGGEEEGPEEEGSKEDDGATAATREDAGDGGAADGRRGPEPVAAEVLQGCAPFEVEAWLARPPEPPVRLSAEEQGLVRRVTRHNPPWAWGPEHEAASSPAPPAAPAAPEPTAPDPPPAPPPAPPAKRPVVVWAKEPLPGHLEPLRPGPPRPRR